MIYVYPSPGKGKSIQLCNLFVAGCKGRIIRDKKELINGPAAFYGMTDYTMCLIKQAIDSGRDWYYIDNGYFGRSKFFRITKNDFQHYKIGKPKVSNYERWKHHKVSLEPWKKDGNHILVCPPGIEFSRLMDINRDAWIENTLSHLKEFTDRELRVRAKPSPMELKLDPNSLYNDLRKCHALVTTHSNAAVNALCYGVPCFTTMKCGAYPLSLHDLSLIEEPIYPENREEWAIYLSGSQWRRCEIGKGMAWRVINGFR